MSFLPPSRKARFKPGLPFHLFLGLTLSLSVVSICPAQVTTNITGDGTLGTEVTPEGNIHNITGGTRSGGNLFHSFGEFNVGAGDTAMFRNTPAAPPTNNILGRVTGGNTSSIFGTIDTATHFPEANLFLTNPAGWVFGPNAALNVAGSVNFTTADYLKHGDGGQFTAFPSEQDSQLSVAAISAFGFLEANPNGIVVDGSTLSVTEGHSISLVSGKVTMTEASLNAPSGEILVASVASPGQVNLTASSGTSGFQVESFASLGTVTLSDGATLDASGATGGTVVIRSGQLVMEGAMTDASSVAQGEAGGLVHLLAEEITLTGSTAITASGDAGGGTILVGGNLRGQGPEPNARRTHVGPDATITADALTDGDGGQVIVWADGITEFYGDISSRGGVEGGNGGFVETSGKQVLHAWGDVDVSAANGSGGTWLLDPANVTILNGIDGTGTLDGDGNPFTANGADSTVSNESIETALNTGNGVEVIISTDDPSSLQVGNIVQNADAAIQKTAGTDATLTLNAANNIELNGGISSTTGALDIALNANDPAQTGHDLNPNSGDVIINSDIDTHGGDFTSTGGNFTAMANSSINTDGSDSGNVNITATHTVSLDNSTIATSATGDVPGTVTIHSHDMVMNNSTISANTDGSSVNSSPNPSRPAIDIEVEGDLVLNDRSTLEANVLGGTRNGGDILLNVEGTLEIRGGSPDFSQGPFAVFDGVQTQAIGGSGRAGDIDVSANSVLIVGDILGIQSSTFSSGTSGDIRVTANSLQIEGRVDGAPIVFAGGIISSLTVGEGQGGNVDINVPGGDIALDNGQITATTFGSGNGGNLTVKAKDVHMINEAILQTGTNGPGNAGSTDIQLTGDLEIRSGSFIGSLVGVDCVGIECGAAGDTTITAKDIIITGVEGAEDPLVSPEFTGIRTRSVAEAGGNVIINGDNLHISDNGVIRSSSIGPERAGDITINLNERLEVTQSGQVLASAQGSGNAGNITVGADVIDIRNEGSSITAESTSAGNAGNVILNGNNLSTNDGAEISSRSASQESDAGGGGNIEINAIDSINLEESNVLTSVAGGTKPGGDIHITAGQDVQLINNTTVSAESLGLGDAGDVTVTSGNDIQMVDSAIRTNAAFADGGNIKLTAPNLIQLINSQITSSVGGGPTTTGGNINLDPLFIILQNSQILANAFQGQGGNITLTATNGIFIGSSSTVDASSALGINGTVVLNGAVVALAETVTQLPQNIVKIASLFAERCAAQKGGQFSSFVQGGSDGLPPSPGGFLPSPLMFTNPGAPSSSTLPSSGQVTFVSNLPQIRLGLDPVIGSADGHVDFGFRGMTLLPDLGCAA